MLQAGIGRGGADGYSLFLVEKGTPGFTLGQQIKVLLFVRKSNPYSL